MAEDISRFIPTPSPPSSARDLAAIKDIQALETPLVTNYQMFRILWGIYKNRSVKYLRGDYPTKETFHQLRSRLRQHNIIFQDPDYRRFWRITSHSDRPADEIVCIADPHTYISHISAMQSYGLTTRRPKALYVSQPSKQQLKSLNAAQVEADFGPAEARDYYVEPLTITHHPKKVRGRDIDVHTTQHIGQHIDIRGSFARIATIGQTFLDTLAQPEKCGGMLHVLDVWRDHASIYVDDIISAVDEAPKSIHKVRAGYILSERLGISHPRIEAWKAYAQRGGSRLLDPHAPFAPQFSEDWMISLNVG